MFSSAEVYEIAGLVVERMSEYVLGTCAVSRWITEPRASRRIVSSVKAA